MNDGGSAQVHDVAVGGNGSLGGNASSTATGVFNGSGEVIATAIGGNSVKPGGPGGDASALASGYGGTISAQATAGGQRAAQAHATVNQTAGGKAKANAATSGLNALATTDSYVLLAELETRTAVASPAPDRSLGSGLNAFAFATAQPLAADVAAVLTGNLQVTIRQFFGGASCTMLGLASLGGALSIDAYFENYHTSLTQTIDLGTLPGLKHLLLGLVNPEFVGNTNYLHFLVTKDGSSFIDETFADTATALAYFTDHALDLGDFTGQTGNLDLGLAFDFAPGSNAGFSSQFLLGAPGVPSPTPLPTSLLLLASGLAGLVGRSVQRGSNKSN